MHEEAAGDWQPVMLRNSNCRCLGRLSSCSRAVGGREEARRGWPPAEELAMGEVCGDVEEEVRAYRHP